MTQRTPSDTAWMALKSKAERDAALYDLARKRRSTTSETPKLGTLPAEWKRMPVTVGLLIAGVYALIFLASQIRGYYSDMDERIGNAIGQHNKDATCHMYRAADQNAAIANIHTQLRDIKATLETLKEKQRTDRRR